MAERFIDANKLKELRELHTRGKIHFETEKDMVDACPTADVEKVRHGHWIEEKDTSYLVHPVKYDDDGNPMLQEYVRFKCSLCGRYESIKEPYCNCGAKMDK